ncbi:hypothetical protein BT09F24_24010 [Escherichia coli]
MPAVTGNTMMDARKEATKTFLAAKIPLGDESTRSINFIYLPQFQLIINIENSDF